MNEEQRKIIEEANEFVLAEMKDIIEKKMIRLSKEERVSSLEKQLAEAKEELKDDKERFVCSNPCCGVRHDGSHDEQMCKYICR